MSFLNKKIFSLDPQIFGLDLSDLSLKVFQFEKEGKIEKIRSYGAMDIPAGFIEDGNIIKKDELAAVIKAAVKKAGPKKIRTKKVICSIPESKAFLRMIYIPPMEESEAAEAIKWEMEANIPLPIDQVYFDWQFLNINKQKKQEILTVAVEKKIVDELMEVLKKAGLDAYGLEVESIATARSLISREDAEKDSAFLIIDLGSQKTSFIVVAKGVPCFTSSIPFSSESINDAISKSLKLNFQEAEMAKVNNGIDFKNNDNPIFNATKSLLENLSQEIEKTLDFYKEMIKGGPEIDKIILCGGGSNLKGLIEYLTDRLKKNIELGNPWTKVNLAKKSKKMAENISVRYPTVIGLALRGIYYENKT